MIKICSFFSLPIEDQRIGPVYSIANSYPRTVGQVAGQVKCLVPPWDAVKAFKNRQIDQAEFTARYRQHLTQHWPEVKQWLDSLQPGDEMYLCCWETQGFCHRILVARLIRHFRPDLQVRLT
jgi:uncharacterized protein YeaO (DUF488 family)